MGIKIRYWLLFSLILINTGLPCNNLYSQESQKKPLRQAALDNFRAGSYEQAYRDYMDLLNNYPKDPQYKYYAALCLINLKKEPGRAAAMLQDALNGSLEIKAVPDDAWFYLGRSQQMEGKFSDAIRSFDHFSDIAGRKPSKDLNVEDFIRQCNEGKGKLDDQEKLISESVLDNGEKLDAGNNRPVEKASEKKAEPVVVRKPPAVKENLPEDYDRTLTQALDYQVKADSLTALASGLREEFNRLPASRKPDAIAKINELESEAKRFQKLADEKFSSTGHGSIQGKDTIKHWPVPEPEKKADQPVKAVSSLPEEERNGNKVKAQPENGTRTVFSFFEISSDPKSIAAQKIMIDPVMPQGLVYRIQIAVFSKPVTPSLFRGITPVSGFRVPGSNAVKYYAGMFRRSEEANKALIKVKDKGFRDSFLNAVLDGKIISIDRASILEKEWGSKPLFTLPAPSKDSGTETGPPTLSFRVEVLKSAVPQGEAIVENYRKMAAEKGLEILSAEGDSIVYLIGKFITFDSASEYANLLVRNGYREARVVAYLGNREIPVDKAKQLFDKAK